MTIDELTRRMERAEKKIETLEKMLETIQKMNISEQMQDYISENQRNLHLAGLLNSVSGQGKIDTSEAERKISQAQAKKKTLDQQIQEAMSAVRTADNPNATPADLFTYKKHTCFGRSGVQITGFNGFDEQTIAIPASIEGMQVISIGQSAFINGTMTEVILPSTIYEICETAFESCKRLKKINIPHQVVSIGKYAFAYCDCLDSVRLPEGLKQIDDWAFSNAGISSISFPSTLDTIPLGCCNSCRKLRDITLADGIKKIESTAFGFFLCSSENLLKYVVIPKSVIELGSKVFENRTEMHVAFLGTTTTVRTSSYNTLTGSKSTLYVIPGSAMQRYGREKNYTMKPLTAFPMK